MTYAHWILIGVGITAIVALLFVIGRYLFRDFTPQELAEEEAEDAELRGATVEQMRAMGDHQLMMLALANLLEMECNDPAIVGELKRRASGGEA